MIKRINHSQEIIDRLKSEGKEIIISDKVRTKSMIEMNEQMRLVHQDFINKSNASWIGAKDVWLD